MITAANAAWKDDLRDIVWRKMVDLGGSDEQFRHAANSLGVFTFLRVVDAVVDVIVAEAALDDATALRIENTHLKKCLARAAEALAEGQAKP